MSNFSINFSHPWLLFLLIPAVVLLVVGIMRVPKRYRNTRNRVVAVVLEAIVYFCVILVLCGLTFTYTTGNAENEIILLVDVTDTMEVSANTRDEYIQEILYEGEGNGAKMGIVTFGFTQVYAAPLSTDYDSVYRQYQRAELPDTTATDLASALEYTAKLFTNPEASKIVIISDGKETDQSALSSLSLVTSQGTAVESVYVPSDYEGSDIQIVSAEAPSYHIDTGEYFEITLGIQSNYKGTVSLHVTDNGEDMALYDDNYSVEDGGREIYEGSNTVTFRTQVFDKYLHAIRITLEDVDDEVLTQNNSYCVYIYIDNYNKILIFEHSEGESQELYDALQGKEGEIEPGEEGPYRITTITLKEGSFEDLPLPLTVNELRQYDLVILENTSNSDMYDAYRYYIEDELDAMGDYYSYFYTNSGNPKSGGGLLPQLLYSYVYDYGGGLLTVGGTDEDGTANMYSRSDMYGTVLQQMIPVTAINYTPPTGIVVVIDTSGSMGTGDGSNLAYAILGVLQSLDLLSVRDYIGVIEFSSNPHIVLNMQSLTYKSEIQAALNNLLENPQSQGTVLYSSFDSAITMLESDSRFERKHIIIVSDGLLSDTEACYPLADKCNDLGITVTAVVVNGGTTGLSNMREICNRADGADNVSSVTGEEKYLYDCSGSRQSDVGNCIYDDIQAIVWEEINYVETQIQVGSSYIFSSLLDGLFAVTTDESGGEVTDRGHLDATLTRFYGTTIKTGADLILTGDYSVPIYAQWSYGAGMVGSFMGDLFHFGDTGDTDSEDVIILDSDAGIQFIINAVDNLMPTQDIRPNGISVTLAEDNYTNRLNVYADVLDGYTVDAKIYACEGEYAGTGWVLDLNTVTAGNTDELDAYVTVAMDASNNYSRANFVIKVSGVYQIVVTLYDENGDVVKNEMGTDSTATLYKKFSYSAEYDTYGADGGLALMNSLSTGDHGGAITDADELVYVFSGMVTRLSREVDPRLPLIIVALALFLLDIAVRKFKWKWPHEIVRDRRAKKAMENNVKS